MNTKVLYTASIQMVLGAKISLSARVFPCSQQGIDRGIICSSQDVSRGGVIHE